MAQTITTKTPLNMVRMATGRYLDTGTVAAYTFSDLGFKPRFVHVINNTSSDELTWIEGMGDATGLKRLLNGTGSALSSLGITVSERGFTFGLDTDLNVTSEQVSWLALG
jgi:hypothetical protein